MLWVLAAIFIVLWALGLSTAYTMGGLIHVLLIVAIIAILIRVIAGRRVV
ncbi:MAG TPA: lmo0937 family membrane protein [Kofleriaceae bacterium]|nr:lmo0937 family membrane protein [Kofleriaceae bacterium]